MAELEAAKSSTTTDSDEKVSFLTYMLSQDSLTSDEALSTSVDLLQAATETVRTYTFLFFCQKAAFNIVAIFYER